MIKVKIVLLVNVDAGEELPEDELIAQAELIGQDIQEYCSNLEFDEVKVVVESATPDTQ